MHANYVLVARSPHDPAIEEARRGNLSSRQTSALAWVRAANPEPPRREVHAGAPVP